MNIFQAIKQETRNFRNKTAVIEGRYSITYGQLISSAGNIAVSLKGEGVLPYHRIGLLCSDGIDYITVALAVLSVPAVVVPVAAEHTGAEIDDILNKIMVDFLIFEKGMFNGTDAHPLCPDIFIAKELYIKNRKNRQQPDSEYFRINPAFIRFSSGTTGTSKGVVLSHETIIGRTSAADRGLNITSNDTILWVLSMSFHFVVTILLFLRRAAAIVLCSHPFPESLIDGITKHRGTFIYASPFHYNLLTRMNSLPPESFRNVRLAVSTAIKLPENTAREFYSKFGFELSEAYGIIELGLPFVNLSRDKSKRSSVGKALPGYEVEIIDRDKDGAGRIHIKGRGMLDAYFSPWQNRRSILDNGWFNTGDMGRIDKDGYLTIVGRDKDVINFTGMKIFPHEVESVLNRFPGVKESRVYAEDHPLYGQLPAAKIVLKEEASKEMFLDDLRRFCYLNLAQYKVPKSFEIVSGLEKTASGKIRR